MVDEALAQMTDPTWAQVLWLNVVVGGLYFLLTLFASYSLLKQWRQRKEEKTTQLGFYTFLTLGCLGRTIFFALQPPFAAGTLRIYWSFYVILNELPSYLLFSCYLFIIFLWAKIYHGGGADKKASRLDGHFKGAFVAITTWLYCVAFGCSVTVICLGRTVAMPLPNPLSNAVMAGVSFSITVFYFVGALGFLTYGIALYRKTRGGILALTPERRRMLYKIGFITSLVTACFFIRTVLLIVWVAGDQRHDPWVWWYTPMYFVFLEIVPLFLLINALRTPIKEGQKAQSTAPLLNARLQTVQQPDKIVIYKSVSRGDEETGNPAA
jgi:hypothetical protein